MVRLRTVAIYGVTLSGELMDAFLEIAAKNPPRVILVRVSSRRATIQCLIHPSAYFISPSPPTTLRSIIISSCFVHPPLRYGRKHNRRAEPPEHEDPVQRLRPTSTTLRLAGVVER